MLRKLIFNNHCFELIITTNYFYLNNSSIGIFPVNTSSTYLLKISIN